jgi:cis-3-alkyl-4-acyloxetan-2-one decarboxylase
MQQMFDRLWHKVLKRPYRAVRTIDTGTGSPVVLLHGLGSSSEAWSNVVTLLKGSHRVIAFDLIGFGDAPKPDWINYDVDDHARAVIAAMDKAGITAPVVLAGHSMGCLVAVRIALLCPGLIDRLVLYEMPLYTDVPSLRRYTMLRKMYFKVFQLVLKKPEYSAENVHRVQKIASHMSGFELSEETWTPYVKSLKNTIINQHTAEDMQQLKIPMDLIYGSLDMVVLKGHVQSIFDLRVNTITTHMVRSRHKITPHASSYIAKRIDEHIEVPVRKKKITKRLAKMRLFDNSSKHAV